jgi:DNA-binding LytR/AlgR family response regulator
MITAIIADDDASSAHVLKELLEGTGKVRLIGEASDGRECIRLCEEMSPEALFLDIRMPRVSGIEVAERVLEAPDPPIVAFITGHDHYAVKAFELAAVDYVVKSLDLDEFQARLRLTVDRMESALERRGTSVAELRERITGIARELADLKKPGKDTFRIPVKDYDEGTVRLLEPTELVYAERRDRRVMLCTTDQEFPTYFTIDRLEARLGDMGFVRANPGALINIGYIGHMIPNGDGSYDVVLTDEGGTTLTASRSRAKALLDSLQP